MPNRMLRQTLYMLLAMVSVTGTFAKELLPLAPDVLAAHGVGMVPIRPLITLLGGTVTYRPDNGQVIVTRAGRSFICTVGSRQVVVNGRQVTLPRTAIEHFGVVFVPIRSLVTAMGGRVDVHTVERTVIVSISQPSASVRLYYRPHATSTAISESYSVLYAVHPDGTGLQRLSYNAGYDRWDFPVVSPDNRFIAYALDSAIYVRPIDSTHDTLQLTPNPAHGILGYDATVAFSPDHQRLAYSRYMRSEDGTEYSLLCTRRLDGMDEQVIAKGRLPVYSPDGRLFAYITEGKDAWEVTPPTLHLMTVDRKQQWDFQNGANPIFNPDGSTMAFMRYYEDIHTREVNTMLVTMPLTGNDAFKPTEPAPEQRTGWDLHASFSPDDKQILFERWGQGLWAMKPDRSDIHQLTKGDAGDHSPVYSHNGDRILFTRGSALSVMPVSGGEVTTLLPRVIVHNISITPDGTHLLLHVERLMNPGGDI